MTGHLDWILTTPVRRGGAPAAYTPFEASIVDVRHRVVQKITCADGATISVQASKFHYSTPRDDEGPWTHVEVGFPDPRPDWWAEHAPGGPAWEHRDGWLGVWDAFREAIGHPRTTYDDVAGYVPVGLVRDYIDQHGGEA